MKTYEYIVLWDLIDDTPEVEEILKEIEGKQWTSFKSNSSTLFLVAEQILEKNHDEWEIYDEDDGVFIVVKENNSDYWELHRVSIVYQLSTTSEEILSVEY
ncbi:hypothetical protein [Volucribacter amazonae]|uniref:Uncharacterized protein n=1 Tax=Volucribacter amazonae TaxID=256731 RepID=A0A9X4SHX0_9PAST|nr:hypothetical protein [Volucribacter amazonae]MDG6895062.1 hypothetical protein [Volucribacter amazonae]